MLDFPKQSPVITIILANLFPVYGVIFWGWTPFYVFWLFWIETLIVAFFNAAKIILCRGEEMQLINQDDTAAINGMQVNRWAHWVKALKYLMMRVFIFLFYSLFIVVFIGMLLSGKDSGVKNFQVLLFSNETFNWAVVIFIINQFIQFFFDFILSKDYLRTGPSDFSALFDGRQLIIHVSVVLGVFLSKFLEGRHFDSVVVLASVVGLFSLFKCAFEIFQYKSVRNVAQTQIGPDVQAHY